MPDVWQTIEQAAVTLGLSVRTVNRHITGGKLQSRLFEGRREVLVPLPEPVRAPEPPRPASPSAKATSTTSAANPTTGQDGGVNFTMGSPSDGIGQGSPAVGQAANAAGAAATHSSVTGEPGSAGGGYQAASGPAYDSVRRAMSADFTDEKPLDLRTMLTLADSADDKASLAVAAYQTLARTAEQQVHSLRRVALGAWASVGVLAAGAILAVGWGTYRLTSTEGTAGYLRDQVTEQRAEIGQLTDERDRARNELVRVQIESARLQDRLAQLSDARSVAEIANYALRNIKQAEDARLFAGPEVPATQSAIAGGASTRPATRPVGVAGTEGNAGTGTGVVTPITQPASKPAMPGQRPTFITNTREAQSEPAFDRR